jgi:hypothetical protein
LSQPKNDLPQTCFTGEPRPKQRPQFPPQSRFPSSRGLRAAQLLHRPHRRLYS